MTRFVTRRTFLATATAAAAGTLRFSASSATAAQSSTRYKKALIGKPTTKTMEAWKAAGFDGMETNVWQVTPAEAAAARERAAQTGMPIHSVMRGWANFNSPDPQQVTKDIDSVKTALRAAQAYGASDILLVPCRLLDKVPVPKPEDFDIKFDPKSCHVSSVVRGRHPEFDPYIRLQNQATDQSRKAIEQLIPVAEQTGVVIALENVWNNFWVKPELAAQFIRSFDSPWVKGYFDIGNHVKYAMPEQWIRALGKLIVRLHVKDFTIDRTARNGGKFVDIRDGDVDWPAVMRELHAIDYRGWFTIEGSGGLSVAEKSRRLDLILQGK